MGQFKNSLVILAPVLTIIFILKWIMWAGNPNNMVFNANIFSIPIWGYLDAILIVCLLVAVFHKSHDS